MSQMTLPDGSTITTAGQATDDEIFEPGYCILSVTGERYCVVSYSRTVYGFGEDSPSNSHMAFFWDGGE